MANVCWCGSGNLYEDCHMNFDIKCEEKKKQGFIIPPRKMIKNSKQIEGIRAAALINNGLLDLIEANIKPYMTTEEIDRMVTKYLKENNAISADYLYEGYPKHVCTSVNDVVCHGIPSNNVILKNGDIVNVDTTLSYNGYYADASRMYYIGEVSDRAKRLSEKTLECLEEGMKAIKPFESTLNDIGVAVEKCAKKYGYSVVHEYCGHGVGLKMHEDPYVLHYGIREKTYLLVPGMVITIEPMINEGQRYITLDPVDGWTVRTKDHKLSAQWEHTILITETGYEILSK